MNARSDAVGDHGGPGVGDRLPPLTSSQVDDGTRVAWRSPRHGAPVVIFLATWDAGQDYLREIAAAEPEFRIWQGRPIVVLPAESQLDAAIPGGVAESLTIVGDAGGEAHRRCGVGEGKAALFIADRWGQIYVASRRGSERELARADEIEEWLRYLATQCPECGVPDEPGFGEWTT